MNGSPAAGANPGSTIVVVCSRAFDRILSMNPGMVADLLIHEMLYGPGLGQNSPTSEEITVEVVKRFGL